MKDLTKCLKMTLRKNGIWMGVIFVLLLSLSLVQIKDLTMAQSRSLALVYEGVKTKERGLNAADFEDNNKRVTDFYSRIESRGKTFMKDGLGPEELAEIKANGIEMAKDRRLGFNIKDLFHRDFNLYKTPEKDWKIRIDGSQMLADVLFPRGTFFLYIGLGILLSSLGHISPFHGFSQPLAFNRKYQYLVSLLLGLGLALVHLGVIFVYGLVSIKTSSLGTVVDFPGIIALFGLSYMRLITVFVISLALGQLTGAFVGHLGLSLWVFGGLELLGKLFTGLIFGLTDPENYSLILNGKRLTGPLIKHVSFEYKPSFWAGPEVSYDIGLDPIRYFLNNLGDFFQGFTSPFSGTTGLGTIAEKINGNPMDYQDFFKPFESATGGTGGQILGAFSLGLILLFLGYFWSKNQRMDRSGYLFLNPILSKIFMVFAIFFTVVFLTSSLVIILSPFPLPLSLALSFIFVYGVFRFYGILFKILWKV